MNIEEYRKEFSKIREARKLAMKVFLANKTKENKDIFIEARNKQINFVKNN